MRLGVLAIRGLRVSDSQLIGPGFESRSYHYLDLFLGSAELKSSATLVNSQLPACLLLVGILNNVLFNLNYLHIIHVTDNPTRR